MNQLQDNKEHLMKEFQNVKEQAEKTKEEFI